MLGIKEKLQARRERRDAAEEAKIEAWKRDNPGRCHGCPCLVHPAIYAWLFAPPGCFRRIIFLSTSSLSSHALPGDRDDHDRPCSYREVKR